MREGGDKLKRGKVEADLKGGGEEKEREADIGHILAMSQLM